MQASIPNAFTGRWPSSKGLAALGLSLIAHMGIFAVFTLAYTQPPRVGAPRQMEMTLSGGVQALQPAPVRKERSTDAIASTAAPASTPAAQTDNKREDAGENAIVGARYDAAALNNPKPHYPLAARRRGIEGQVLLVALVKADGSCAQVTIKQSSGHGELDTAALETVRRWRFIPARRGDTAVESWVEVPITFRLAGSSA